MDYLKQIDINIINNNRIIDNSLAYIDKILQIDQSKITKNNNAFSITNNLGFILLNKDISNLIFKYSSIGYNYIKFSIKATIKYKNGNIYSTSIKKEIDIIQNTNTKVGDIIKLNDDTYQINSNFIYSLNNNIKGVAVYLNNNINTLSNLDIIIEKFIVSFI